MFDKCNQNDGLSTEVAKQFARENAGVEDPQVKEDKQHCRALVRQHRNEQ